MTEYSIEKSFYTDQYHLIYHESPITKSVVGYYDTEQEAETALVDAENGRLEG